MSKRTDKPDTTGDTSETSPGTPQPTEAGALPMAEEKSQPTQAGSAPARLIYVGPNVPGGILQRYQVFKGGLPPYCEDLFKKVPEIKELFVPVEGLEAVRQKIEESGTNEARLFYVVQSKLKGVK